MIGNPFPLKQNAAKSFQGSIVLGKGFVLTHQEAQLLIDRNPRNKDVIFPYLNGDDLNNDPDQKASRWVINFFDWSEKRARTYPDCFEIIERLVKPERLKQKDKGGQEKWWQFLRPRNELYETISKLDQVMVINRHSKYLLISPSKKDIVFSEATVVLAVNSPYYYAILSSSIHEVWAWKYASTLESRMRYTASDIFETFPFPVDTASELKEGLIKLGEELNQVRSAMTGRLKIGLTQLYNLFNSNNPKQDEGEQLNRLRLLHMKLDSIVLEAYGWTDLDLQHNFYPQEQLPENDRIRFTVSPMSRKELLKRLLKLNHQMHAAEGEEVEMATHRTQVKINDSPTLF